MNVNRVIQLADNNKGRIFGGYLRDTILGEEPKDIDVWFQTQNDVHTFVCDMACVTSVRLEEVNDYAYRAGLSANFNHFRLFTNTPISNLGESARGKCNIKPFSHIDLIVKDGWLDEDIDVNMLYLEKGDLKAWRGNVIDIIRNIRMKRFVPFLNCPSERMDKLIARGWEMVGLPRWGV